MSRWWCLFLILLSGSVGPLWGSSQVRYLHFSAQDQNGIYLRDLKLEEVQLQLDGRQIPVRYLGYRNVETAFAFLLENSPRTAPYPRSLPQWGQINLMDQVRHYLLTGFLRQIVQVGPCLLGQFYRAVEVLQDFTAEDYQLEQALRQMVPLARRVQIREVAVGRALATGVNLLAKRPEKRKILVLFTATVDRDSYQNLEEYRQMFRLSDVELYVVSFAPRNPTGSGFTFEEKMNRYFFQRLTGETAGKLYVSGEYVFFEEFMNDLMTTLANSYTIGFYVEPGEEPEGHEVSLTVRHPKVRVTHRRKLYY